MTPDDFLGYALDELRQGLRVMEKHGEERLARVFRRNIKELEAIQAMTDEEIEAYYASNFPDA